jgi:nanoRNase/pAp phosphatase (c-di-AMP/oligoRNAs hydrolase)
MDGCDNNPGLVVIIPEIAMTAGGERKHRLITRSDMDGLVCAVLLRELELIGDIVFVHPKDMQDGKIDTLPVDITTNLPYVPGVHLAFDHHASEMERNGEIELNHVIDHKAPSAARVVYDYYGGKEAFPTISDDMMTAVDKADSAAFSREDVLRAKGWELLSFLMDSRTGLGRFRDFRISNYELMMDLIEYCRSEQNIEKILQLPDVAERVALYRKYEDEFKRQIERCTTMHGSLAVLDLRDEETIWPGNRFMIYALFPQSTISCHVIWGRNKQNTVFAIGKSIFDRDASTDVGSLCLKHGGGGHNAAGTCQVENDQAERTLNDIIATILRNEQPGPVAA